MKVASEVTADSTRLTIETTAPAVLVVLETDAEPRLIVTAVREGELDRLALGLRDDWRDLLERAREIVAGEVENGTRHADHHAGWSSW